MNQHACLCLFVVVLCIGIPVFAQESTVTLQEIIVSATRYEEALSSVPAPVATITQEVMRNSSARTVPELLRTELGIHVSDLTGNSRNYIVDLRGYGETASANTLVLIDGRRVNLPDLSGVDWTLIPLERVDRIEVVRSGRGSVLYGDNASGGVINIITKSGKAFEYGGSLAFGSYDAFNASAYSSGSSDKFSYHVSGDYGTSDGYRDNSDTEAKDFGATLDFSPSAFTMFTLSGGYHKDRTGLPGALKKSDLEAGVSRTATTHPHDFAEVEDYYVAIGPSVSFLGDHRVTLDMSYRKRAFLSFASGDFGNFQGDSEMSVVTLSPRLLLKHRMGKVRNIFTIGVDYSEADNDIANTSLFFGETSRGTFDFQKKNLGSYLHDEVHVADKISLSAGYRHDRAEYAFRPSTPDEKTFDRDLFTAGVTYAVPGKASLYLGMSKSYRYPLFDELYSFFTNTIDTRLKPQTTDDYELGLRYTFSRDTHVNINLFRTDTTDEIFLNPQTYINENVEGTIRREGVEIDASVKPVEWLTVKATYTYIEAELSGSDFAGKDVPNVPRHRATMGLVTTPTRGTTLSLDYVYLGKRPFISDFSNAFPKQESYVLLNTKFEYRWKKISAFLTVNNITNETYAEYGVLGGFPVEEAFYPSPGRNFLAGISYGF